MWWFSHKVVSDSCDPMDCSPPGSSVHGIFQARILEWIAISFSRGSSKPRNWTQVSCITGRFFTNWAIREAHIFFPYVNIYVYTTCVCVKLLQLCLTLYDLMDCRLSGSADHRILQARILEWIVSPPPGNLPDPGADPVFLMAPALAGIFFSSRATTGLLHHWLLQAVVYRMRSHALHSPNFNIFLQLFWLELTKLGQNSSIWELITKITFHCYIYFKVILNIHLRVWHSILYPSFL